LDVALSSGESIASADPSLGRRFAVDGKDLATVIVVAVEQAFQHCPKALVRSNLWQTAAGGRPQGRHDAGRIRRHAQPGTDGAAIGI
jgi:hypothetical protein